MRTLLQDLRGTLRVARRSPGLTLLVVCLLALGIGANTAIFTIIDAVLLRPFPYRSPDRLVYVWSTHAQLGRDQSSARDLFEWQHQSRTLSQVAALMAQNFTLTGVEEPERLRGAAVSVNFFSTLGVSPALGSDFGANPRWSDASSR
jgi:hypothetical protein